MFNYLCERAILKFAHKKQELLQEHRLHLLFCNCTVLPKVLYILLRINLIQRKENHTPVLLGSRPSCRLLPPTSIFSLRSGLSAPALKQEDGLEDLLAPSSTVLLFLCSKLWYSGPSPTLSSCFFREERKFDYKK